MIYWVLAGVGAMAVAVSAQHTSFNELEAVEKARAAVVQHDWVKQPACVDYIAVSKEWVFDLHEKHDAVCGGDPDTAPRILRVRVDAATGAVSKGE